MARLPLTISIFVATMIALVGQSSGQVAPIGGHHFIAAGGAESVGAPTGVGATVALELLPSRDRLPLPLRLVYSGAPSVGAAGIGWDVPISYVRVSTSLSRRKPSLTGSGSAPRLFMSLKGVSQLMVPTDDAGRFAPMAGSRAVELVDRGTYYEALDASGIRYVFREAASISSALARDIGLFLLTEIHSATGFDQVAIEYSVRNSDCHTDAPELSVHFVRYSPRAGGTLASRETWLHEVELVYETTIAGIDCGAVASLGIGVESGVLHSRSHLLSEVVLRAQDNLGVTPGFQTIRAYSLSYTRDTDSGAPRLSAVDVRGAGGVGSALPVSRYEYGAVSRDGAVRFSKDPLELPRFALGGPEQESLSTSSSERFQWPQGSSSSPALFDYEVVTTTQVLRDFTGDGIADLVYQQEGALWIVPNYTDALGSSLRTQASRMAIDATLGVETIRTPTAYGRTWIESPSALAITTETWTMLIDWNGDGRLDILDAANAVDENHWKLWLNRPNTSNEYAIEWEERDVLVGPLREWQAAAGLGADMSGLPMGTRMPLSRKRSWSNGGRIRCHEWNWDNLNGWIKTSGDCAISADETNRLVGTATGGVLQETVTEWQVQDANGDGYPDFVTDSLALGRALGRQGVDCEYFSRNLGRWVNGVAEPAGLPTVGITKVQEHCIERSQLAFRTEESGSAAYNDIVVFYNRTGVKFGGNEFRTQPEPYANDSANCGVAQWRAGPDASLVVGDAASWPVDQYLGDAWQTCGFIDWNGDGILDRIASGRLGGLGTGQGFVGTRQQGALISYFNDRHVACAPESYTGTYTQRQTSGLLDLTGDGLPDHVYADSRGWHLRANNGAGFGPVRDIEGAFELSKSTGKCGEVAFVTEAAVDINGDGRPELLSVDAASATVLYRQLIGSDGALNAYGASRLVQASNGMGARVVYQYTSAKAHVQLRRDLPFPEIVLASVQTQVDGGDDLDPVRYAYGDAQLRYDPIMHVWRFTGYSRRVTMSGDQREGDGAGHITGREHVHGVVLVEDSYVSTTYGGGYSDYLLNGKPSATYQLEGDFLLDPWKYILANVANDSNLRAGGTQQHAVSAVTTSSGGAEWRAECWDTDPYSIGGVISDYALCGHTGVPYVKSERSWQGYLPPPALSNIEIATEVLDVDEFGRATRIKNYNDTRILDDDICIEIGFAKPAAGRHVYDAVATRKVTNCGFHGSRTYAGERFIYDGELPGIVGNGQLTKLVRERYDLESGTKLDEHVAAEVHYDGNAYGRPSSIVRTRTLGSSATASIILEYDSYGYFVARSIRAASDAPALISAKTRSFYPSVPVTSTDPNGVERTIERDSFGRPTAYYVSTGQGRQTTATVRYDDDARPRTVTVSQIRDIATPLESVVYLDPLGRTERREQLLGADYGGARLVSAVTRRDGMGRVEFAADPFVATGSQSYDVVLRYGTSFSYKPDGEATQRVRGWGYQPDARWARPGDELFPTVFDTRYERGRRIVSTSGAAERTAGNVAYGVEDIVEMSAIGRPFEVRRNDGQTVLSMTRYQHDALGHAARVTRYTDPNNRLGGQTMAARFDSFGRRVELREPGLSTKYFEYDEWGGLYETSWVDGANAHYDRAGFDGYGRITDRELVRVHTSYGTSVESHSRYFYDMASGSVHQPGSKLMGRMSHMQQDGVMETFFAYDDLGRVKRETRVSLADTLGRAFTTETQYDRRGQVRLLRLVAPGIDDTVAYVYDSAGRVRRVQWEGTSNSATLFEAQEIDALGRYRSVLYGNGVVGEWDYGSGGRQLLASQSVRGSFGVLSRQYSARDSAGRTNQRKDTFWDRSSAMWPAPSVSNFSFDKLKQLVGVQGFGVGSSAYSFDSLGNVLSMAENGGSAVTLEYGDGLDRARVTKRTIGAAQEIYRYDGAGNVNFIGPEGFVMWGTSTYLGYDSANRATWVSLSRGLGATSAAIKWDATGGVASIEMTTGSYYAGNTVMLSERRYGDKLRERYVAETDDYQVERIIPGPLGDLAVLRKSASGASVLYTHRGSDGRLLSTDETGQVAQRVSYSPFGTVTTDTAASNSFDYSRTQWNSGTSLSELGVVLLGPRLYSPRTGRFLQRDPIIRTSGSGANPYSFANNDPINFADPSGLSPCDALAPQCGGITWWKGVGAAVAGTGVAAGKWVGGIFGGRRPAGARTDRFLRDMSLAAWQLYAGDSAETLPTMPLEPEARLAISTGHVRLGPLPIGRPDGLNWLNTSDTADSLSWVLDKLDVDPKPGDSGLTTARKFVTLLAAPVYVPPAYLYGQAKGAVKTIVNYSLFLTGQLPQYEIGELVRTLEID